MENAILTASVILGFALMVGFAAFGSAIGDGIIGSKAVESIARQPEARPNIFFFYFLGFGILESFPIIAIGLAFFLLIGGGGVGVMKAVTPILATPTPAAVPHATKASPFGATASPSPTASSR